MNVEIKTAASEADSTVCYCFRLTTSQLRAIYARVGSLKELQKCTRAGTACGGCGVVLRALFGEEPNDLNKLDVTPELGTSCIKPGQRTMRGLVVDFQGLESSISSSNAVAPQLGQCDSTTEVEYSLVDYRGKLILAGSERVRTNENFKFSTRGLQLEKPFIGIFSLTFDRSNYGASRFNIYWSNEKSTCSTHENSSTGRPRMFIPLAFDARFLKGSNNLYLGIMNPHHQPIPFKLFAFDLESKYETLPIWHAMLNPLNSTWIDINQNVLLPVFTKHPDAKIGIKLETSSLDTAVALSSYFFLHCKKTDTWAANHL